VEYPAGQTECLEAVNSDTSHFRAERTETHAPLPLTAGSGLESQAQIYSAFGSSTNTSTAMSGSMWLVLMKAITLRSRASSTTFTRSSRMRR
jgi:hypothetical protein